MRVNGIVKARPLESFTVKVNASEAAEDGVPLTTPLDDNDSPAGNDPDARLKLYGGTPPDREASVAKFAE